MQLRKTTPLSSGHRELVAVICDATRIQILVNLGYKLRTRGEFSSFVLEVAPRTIML